MSNKDRKDRKRAAQSARALGQSVPGYQHPAKVGTPLLERHIPQGWDHQMRPRPSKKHLDKIARRIKESAGTSSDPTAYTCPTCSVKPGQSCVTPKGKKAATHKARKELAA